MAKRLLCRCSQSAKWRSVFWILWQAPPDGHSTANPIGFFVPGTLVAHGWRRLLPFAGDDEPPQLERVERLNDGRVVQIQIREERETLQIDVSQDADEAEVTAIVRRMLQLDLPLDAFHAFCAAYPELTHIVPCKKGRMLVSPTLWEDALKVICTTNTTWAQTRAMVARIVNAYGSPLPTDPTRHAFPTPEQIASAPFDEFCATAKLGYRNAAVHSLAREITEGKLDLEALREMDLDSETLWKRLLALRGVGPYAASCLMLYLGRPERVNADSWARMLLGKELGHSVTDKNVHDFFEPYGQWRGLVYNFYGWRQEEPSLIPQV